MPRTDEHNRLSQWIIALREFLPTIKPRLRDRYIPLHETPTLAWHYPEIKYTTYLLAALVMIWLVRFAIVLIQPGPPESFKPQATTADFQVFCTNPQCPSHDQLFVIHREFGFHGFPVECPVCKKLTGLRALKCFSPTCNGKLIPARYENSHWVCTVCGQVFPRN